ncbi:hypothetical protein OG936_35890 [Streptomyces sp. NBC_00846]|nr:hypothetical protein OG936_35890 [Streptomyces sp. NBC_00846]
MTANAIGAMKGKTMMSARIHVLSPAARGQMIEAAQADAATT